MSAAPTEPGTPPPHPQPGPPAHRRRTERRLVIGFFLLLLLVGGGLIAVNYGWGGMIGGLLSIVACSGALVGLGGLLWALLTWAGRWADGEP